MRLLRIVAAAACLIASPVQAIFADEAQFSYHHELIGAPLANSTFFAPPYAGSKGSLVFSLSELGVLGAINPKDGSLVWRQQLANDPRQALDTTKILKDGNNQGLLFAAVGSNLSAWGAAEGRLAWKKTFGQDARVKDVQLLPDSTGTSDLIVLVEAEDTGATVYSFDGASGSKKWAYTDASGETAYGLATSASTLYYVSLSKALLKGYKIKITQLARQDGSAKDSVTLGSENDLRRVEDILFLGMPSVPFIAWTDSTLSTIHANVLGSKSITQLAIKAKDTPITNIKIHAPSEHGTSPQFLAHVESVSEHWAEVFSVDAAKKTVSRSFELDKLDGPGSHSVCTIGSDVYFARFTPFETSVVISTSAKYLGRWIMPAQLGVPGIQSEEAFTVNHAASEVVVRGDGSHALRSSALLSTGDWILVRNDAVDWVRHEGLSTVVHATFGSYATDSAGSTENILIEEQLDAVSAFIHRIKRHLKLLQSLPDFAQEIPALLSAWFESFIHPGSYDSRKDSAFGFNKVAIVLNKDDRLIALETHNQGRVVWSRRSACEGSISTRLACSQVLQDVFGNPVQVVESKIVADSQQSILHEKEHPAEAGGAKLHEVSYTFVKDHLRGFIKSSSQKAKGRDLWTFTPLPGQHITSVVSRLHDEPVASIGKALADRSVLYKYLNPNIILVTAIDAKAQLASFYVLDAVSGSELTAFHHANVDTERPITTLLSENWLTYSFTSVPADETLSAGAQLIVAELYESAVPNDRGPLGANANFSTFDPTISTVPTLPYVVSQAYVVPEEITSMAVTQTTQGITSRNLLVTLASHALVSIPRQVLDPRRTLGKAPTQPQAIEEGLSQYAPVIEFNPQWYLSHVRDVIVDKVIASPSGMESTSLIFAWGLDVFGGRVAPSFTFDILGANFNKIQLILTVIGLFIGTVAVAPIVGRKGVNGLWQSPT